MLTRREPNFEILRVFCMFLIVIWHFIRHGLMHALQPESPVLFVDISSSISVFNYLSTEFLLQVSGVAVNCYVLISGYFLIKSSFRWEKFFKIWLQAFFYSVVIFLIVWVLGCFNMSYKDLIRSVFVIKSENYWFVTKYLALLALSPFLARLAILLKKNEYRWLLGILFVLNVSLIGGFPYGNIYSRYNDIFFFVFLFFISGYIRLYGFYDNRKIKWGRLFIISCFILFTGYFLESLIYYLREDIPFCYRVTVSYNGFAFFTSVMLFLWARKARFEDNTIWRFIAKIAPYSFGVYLIHDNYYIRKLIWERWIHASGATGEWFFLPYMAAICILVFMVCICIDYFRTRLFTVMKLNEYVPAFLMNTISKTVSRITRNFRCRSEGVG